MRLGRVVEASAVHSFALGQPAHLRWLEALLLGFANAVDNAYAARVRLPLDFTVVEAMVRSTGRPAGEALVSAFHTTGAPSYYGHGRYRVVLRGLHGYAEAVARHAEALRPALASTKVDDRLVALEMLDGLPADVLGLFAAELADYATSTSSKVRSAALAPIRDCGAAAFDPLKEIATNGKPGNRVEALELLYSDGDPDVRAWALATAGEDRAASVRALVEQWTDPPGAGSTTDDPGLPAVEVPTIEWRTPVTPELTAQLERLVAKVNRDTAESNEQQRRYAQQWQQQHGTSLRHQDQKLLDRGFLPGLLAALESGKPAKPGQVTSTPTTCKARSRALCPVWGSDRPASPSS